MMAASRTKASFWPASRSQTHRNNRLRRNRLLSTCTEMQRPPLECLERRELKAANPILRGNAFLTLGSTRTESGDVPRRLQSLSQIKFRLYPLGCGRRQLQLMAFQYGNLGPHGQ